MKTHLIGLTLDELSEALSSTAEGTQRYRCSQMMDWIYRHRTVSFESMSNVPSRLRRMLDDHFDVYASEVIAERRASDGTLKQLLQWKEGGTTECVLIPEKDRSTACISTQVGCPVRCTFCASGLEGLQRNLSAGEIVEQAHRMMMAADPKSPLTNVVFMGLGEPLANYDATVKAVRIINASWAMNIAARRITISTVGLPSQIRKLATENLQVTLALSLHAPTDELRSRLIPWAKLVRLDELIQACAYYFDQTGREVTLEYILLEGVNDQADHAQTVAQIARKIRCNINLIPYHPVSGLEFRRPGDAAMRRFLMLLRQRGINTHLRRSRGMDIEAACGQLRRREQATSSHPEIANLTLSGKTVLATDERPNRIGS